MGQTDSVSDDEDEVDCGQVEENDCLDNIIDMIFDDDDRGSTACCRKRFFERHADYRMARNMDVVYIHLGENDYRHGADPTTVAEELFKSAQCLVDNHEVKRVVISELLPFPKCDRQWVMEVNERLSLLVKESDTILLSRQKKAFWSKRPRVYHSDGVHVSHFKMHIYAQGVRFGIMHACNRLNDL